MCKWHDRYYDGGVLKKVYRYQSNGLSIHRQVYLNSSYENPAAGRAYFVRENNELNELILSEKSINIDVPFRCNISISNPIELHYKIQSVINDAKEAIIENFREEIYKSKLEICIKDFNSKITNQVITDNFQHVIDLVTNSEIIENYSDKVLFLPMSIKVDSNNNFAATFDLDQKVIDIFYELMEGTARIRGEYDVETKIIFKKNGIYLKIHPKLIEKEPIQSEEEKRRDYMQRRLYRERRMYSEHLVPSVHIRDPYNDLPIWE
jgi:hypothetical protein